MLLTGKWFAVSVRARLESAVDAQLRHKGLEVFLPVYRSQRRWSDRVKTVTLPLFPGYLFCRFDLADKSTQVVKTPGVIRLLGTPAGPEPVNDTEIQAIQRIVAAQLPVGPWPYAKNGSKVLVWRGPLAGIEGIISTVKSQTRLIVSLTLLGRSLAVDIDADSVTLLAKDTLPHGIPLKARAASAGSF